MRCSSRSLALHEKAPFGFKGVIAMSNSAEISLASAQPPAAPALEKASLTSWIAVLASMIGAFMAILNIQITNASLLDIEGGIGTGVDNGAWISTSYLIGEIIVIPLTDYLSRVFSFRRFILVNTILFAALLDRLRLHPRSRLDDRYARPPGFCRRRADSRWPSPWC